MTRQQYQSRQRRLAADLLERHELRRIMADHSSEAVSRELGVSQLTVQKIDVTDAEWMYPRIARAVVLEVSRRRRIYHEARALYAKRYSGKALARRYGLSSAGIQKASARALGLKLRGAA